METAIIVALVGGAYALMGAVLGAVVNYHRSKLEARRIDHERQRWLLELHAKFEDKLHDLRVKEYPPMLADLELLSHYRIQGVEPEQLRELASKLNTWGYSLGGLCMSGATRDALFALRFKLTDFIDGKIDPESFMAGPRTDLIELMRPDLNHSTSTWRNLPSLLAEIESAVKRETTAGKT